MNILTPVLSAIAGANVVAREILPDEILLFGDYPGGAEKEIPYRTVENGVFCRRRTLSCTGAPRSGILGNLAGITRG